MRANRSNIVGRGLILGAALGFAMGMIATNPTTAALLGAIGAGVGIVLGAAASGHLIDRE